MDDYRWDRHFGKNRSRMRKDPLLGMLEGMTEVVD